MPPHPIDVMHQRPEIVRRRLSRAMYMRSSTAGWRAVPSDAGQQAPPDQIKRQRQLSPRYKILFKFRAQAAGLASPSHVAATCAACVRLGTPRPARKDIVREGLCQARETYLPAAPNVHALATSSRLNLRPIERRTHGFGRRVSYETRYSCAGKSRFDCWTSSRAADGPNDQPRVY